MPWVMLVVAGLLEIVWAVGIKHTDGFSRLCPTIVTLLAMGCSSFLLGMATRTIPISVAYTIWNGIGIAGTVIIGIVYEHETAGFLRILFILMIASGITGLMLTSTR